MTPKEKAKELSIKLCSHQDVFKPNLASNRKAIICVDEILNLDYFSEEGRAYWNEVREELEKL